MVAKRTYALGAVVVATVLLGLGLSDQHSVDTTAQSAAAVLPRSAGPDAARRADVPGPSTCHQVAPGDDLQKAIDHAADGATLCLQAGRYQGTFHIEHSVRLVGPRDAVIVNPGHGSAFTVHADHVTFRGFTISGTGDLRRKQDAGVFVAKADDVHVEHMTMRHVLYGVTVQQANGLRVLDNDISCRRQTAMGIRGDSIRLWEARHSLVRGNRLHHCRDLVVWYSPDNVIENNLVEDGRYGTHFMYSSRNLVQHNRYVRNVVGVFVMYSRNIRLDSNVLADSNGASGVGLGLKESGNLEITRNEFIHNAVGVYSDTAPLDEANTVLYAYNDFRLNNVGFTYHSPPVRNTLVANTFKDNITMMSIEGEGDATHITWDHNYYGEYAGYDLNDDGVGDVPFESRSVTNQLLDRYPKLAVFMGAPAMFLIETAARVSPMYQPHKLMSDAHPLMQVVGESNAVDSFASIRKRLGVLHLVDTDGLKTPQPIHPEAGKPRRGY